MAKNLQNWQYWTEKELRALSVLSLSLSSSCSHDSHVKGNNDDKEIDHVDCNSEMFTMSSGDQYDESLLLQCVTLS